MTLFFLLAAFAAAKARPRVPYSQIILQVRKREEREGERERREERDTEEIEGSHVKGILPTLIVS